MPQRSMKGFANRMAGATTMRAMPVFATADARKRTRIEQVGTAG